MSIPLLCDLTGTGVEGLVTFGCSMLSQVTAPSASISENVDEVKFSERKKVPKQFDL